MLNNLRRGFSSIGTVLLDQIKNHYNVKAQILFLTGLMNLNKKYDEHLIVNGDINKDIIEFLKNSYIETRFSKHLSIRFDPKMTVNITILSQIQMDLYRKPLLPKNGVVFHLDKDIDTQMLRKLYKMILIKRSGAEQTL